ncbi:DUF1800 domain-containing protein [Terrimonas sp. NA20]|uniref:DUF1800 domain-containing protein n=1 Tax=Terrimonas ginsenosidimutans TaxID=2908004 RepID=A0ABS9KVP8_9BACT|nr:DUF1800 domain-containing protein [Terrimonas ginsenosidimutans]MCG2616437.1 DUF1800 domain-containing protein [Terrimonas ginsenosidimutans]
MDRRAFLTAGRTKNAPIPAAPEFRTESGLNEYQGAWTRNEAQHLLKRLMFGSAKQDIDYFSSRTMQQAVDELLNPASQFPAPPVNDYTEDMADPVVAPGATWINDPTDNNELNEFRQESFKKWWAGVMLNQDRSIREKLTLMWADHFGTETNTIRNAHFIYKHNDLLRKDCLGNFRKMVKDVTIDPGMLIYLNGYLNEATAPDENYARELMELYTLGKGPTVAYTEPDVRTAASVLTGWRINPDTLEVYFDPAKHDIKSKTFSSYYNNTVIPGRTGADGALETDDLISMLFAKQETSKYICRCIYRWFVYYKIDAAAEANVIVPLSIIFRSNNYEIKPVLEALFKSEHFFDVLNQGCLIKSPVDHVIGCMREFNVVFPAVADYTDAYGMWSFIRSFMQAMGQNIGDPPDVSGWPAYYQEPAYHEMWITHDTLPKRNQFTDLMTWNGHTRNEKTIIIDVIAFTKTLSNPGDPNRLVADALGVMYRVPVSDTAIQSIKQSILLSGQTQDYYWTNAWNGYLSDPGNMQAQTIISNRLKSLYQYLMNLSEYQLS